MVVESYTQALAEFAAAAAFERLTPQCVHATKRLIIDTLGCAVGGYEAPSSRIIHRVMTHGAGGREATALVSGRRLSVAQAAYVNSHMSNALDADDDFHYKAHIAAAVVAPALAMAERQGSSGADLIEAVAIGYDVAARIGLSLKGFSVDEQGQVKFAPITGYSWCGFAAALACGHLLRLDAAQMTHAIGLTCASVPLPSSTAFSLRPNRPMSKYAMYGTISEAGVMAALLASEGMTSEDNALDGPRGFWHTVGSLGCREQVLIDRLGMRWMIEEASYKMYPACRFTNAASDMYLSLQGRHGFQPTEIERVDIGLIGPALIKQLADATVHTLVDGCFSMPYVLAVTALGGPPGPNWHTPEMRARADVRALASKVHVQLEPTAAAKMAEDIRRDGHASRLPSSIRIHTRGQVFEANSDYARGDVYTDATVVSDSELEDKFGNFCSSSLTATQIASALETGWSLERRGHVAELVTSLVAGQPDRPQVATAAASGP